MNTSSKDGNEQELRNALRKGAPEIALITFLDSINSIGEFENLVPLLEEASEQGLVEFYRESLTRWENPQLPASFEEKCPLLFARLDTPQKIRILLRGADFRNVPPLLMGEVLENIIHRHEVDREQKVVYRRYYGDQWCDALRIVYHTQLQAWTLTRLALPGCRSAGVGTDGLYIDWRIDIEKKVADKKFPAA